jgi:hypothetical protein
MTEPSIAPEQVQCMGQVAGLHVDPAYLPGVAYNLAILLRQAALFVDPPLDPLVEPAPVFRP